MIIVPKVIVVSAGQNNHGDSPEEIAEGIKEICGVIRSKQPQAFLVLLVSVIINVIIIILIGMIRSNELSVHNSFFDIVFFLLFPQW